MTVTAASAAVSGRVRMVGDHGDFTVELSNLPRGANRVTLRATARGYKPWTHDVVISRRR